jgi:RNA polymerase sigma factor (TIGR02999 family)
VTPVTQLLEAANRGDRQAAAELLPLVYDELRKLAAARMAHEKPGQTLDATALVHEAYLRLVGDQQFDGRGHFFAAAAEAMRRILVESARRKAAEKRGGDRARVALSDQLPGANDCGEDVVELSDALDQLAGADSQAAELVKLHYFAGLTVEQTAAVLGISERKAYSVWAFARAWLFRALGGGTAVGQ